jgi:hypothetical protein
MQQTQNVAIKSEMRRSPSAGLLLSLLALTTPAIAHHEIGSDHSGTLLSMEKQPAASKLGTAPIKAMYDTKAEAEEAATLFNCKGAHQMGAKWMPCDAHNHGPNAGP